MKTKELVIYFVKTYSWLTHIRKVLKVTDYQHDANQNHSERVLSHLLGQVL